MSMIRYKKRYNKWYVYEVSHYWDKSIQKPRQKSKYLGVAEEKGGIYTKPKRYTKTKKENAILDYGDSYAINEVSKNIGLTECIGNSFSDIDSILALICYQITEGSAMYNTEAWLDGNIARELFPEARIDSQSISRLIKVLGDQNSQIKFFKEYIKKFFPNETGMLIDSTALPSSINSSINALGYSGGIIEENVTCIMLVDKKSRLPMYFRAISGDIADVSSLKTTVAEVKKLGIKADSAILDAGYCSKENIQFMCQEKINFITRLPKNRKDFNELIENIEDSKNAIQYGERFVFIKSKKIKLYDNDIYAHVILDPGKKNKDINRILRNKEEFTEEEINKKLKSAGMFILLSSEDIDEKSILPSYYERQIIEQIFGFAKHNNNLLPLRVHSEQSIKGYLMLVFLSIIIFVTMRQKLKTPMDKALLTLRNLKAKIFDDEIIVQELNKKTKDIFSELNIIMPTV